VNSFPLWPKSASTLSGNTDALFIFMLVVCGLVTVLIFTLIFYFAIKYRRRSELERPKPSHAPMALEVVWIAVPSLFFATFFGWGAAVYLRYLDPPEDALRIYVVGKQWMWKLQHPEGQSEINQLHVPVNRAVQLILTSQDVIHSFFIPAFRVKRDAVPGRYTTLWFEAKETGTYHLFCAEYCGTEHSHMVGTVTVMEAADYQRWLASARGGDNLAAAGEQLFQRLGCPSCHGKIAPALQGVYMKPVPLASGETVTADENYLRESILDPGAKIVKGFPNLMPSFRGQVTEDGLLQLIAYIRSQGAPAAAGPGAGVGAPQAEETK
jgi:cytochrome c oxidase subunit 2